MPSFISATITLSLIRMLNTYQYKVRLMFEWGGGTLWSGNDYTRGKYGFGNIENALPISKNLVQRLGEMQVWHDTALNWEYPPDPGPWSPEQYDEFEKAVIDIMQDIKQELGQSFEVVYVKLGQFGG